MSTDDQAARRARAVPGSRRSGHPRRGVAGPPGARADPVHGRRHRRHARPHRGGELSAAFGQQFVPESKTGASGLIAAAEAAHAAPDGYTLFVSGVGGLIIASAISPNPPADAVTGYTHIAGFGGPPAVLLVNNEVPAKSLEQFIAHAKANLGKLNYG